MKLSVVDLGTVAPGSTESAALEDALATAVHAEEHGYHRIWFAEHHLSRSGASHHPELLIAAASQRTSRIRIGSGAVLMNHYSPFKIAEMYQELEALAWLYDAFPDGHPFAGNPVIPSVGSRPETWVLGSSPGSAGLAGALGIGYTYAGFINPTQAVEALTAYRSSFRPGGFGPDAPTAILAVNVAVGETDTEAARLVASAKGYYARLSRAGLDDGRTEVEVMVQDLIADPVDRRRSHELLAGAF